MTKTLYALRKEAKENREKLKQLLTDIQATLPMFDDVRVSRMLEGFQDVMKSLREED